MAISREATGCCKGKEAWKSPSSEGPPRSHLNAPEDAVGVYSVLGTAENGGCVVVTLIPCAVAANTKQGQGSGRSTGASALEGMLSKTSRDSDSWLVRPSTGATLETGLGEGWGRSTLASHHHAALPHAQVLRAGRLGLCLSDKLGKVTVAGLHPRQVGYHPAGELTAATISGTSSYLKFHIKCNRFSSAPHDSVFTRQHQESDDTEEMSHSPKWGLHICGPAPLNLQISFQDHLNSSQPTHGVSGHWIIPPSIRLASPLVGLGLILGCSRELGAVDG